MIDVVVGGDEVAMVRSLEQSLSSTCRIGVRHDSRPTTMDIIDLPNEVALVIGRKHATHTLSDVCGEFKWNYGRDVRSCLLCKP